jgi:hypothetical protein
MEMLHMSSKVLFLGAGASADAEYPLCKDIFNFLEDYLRINRLGNYADDWKRFEDFRNKHEEFKDLRNVEIFYTKLEGILNQECGSNKFEFENVLDALSRMIDYRFGLINGDYKKLKSENKYLYFEKMISNSDHIITVNWDNLCEFILSDLNFWSPTDGYGIPIKLKKTVTGRRVDGVRPDPFDISIKCSNSKVTVFKLHGSMGWRKNRLNALLEWRTVTRPYNTDNC